ncbi:DUF1937 family protein [Pseudomonas argentinensis]|uniref:DUF7768 domain-containing protein n=1 Tax=Phytopseudomonas argentinensis TaxID=289370 RepID=A0A1I3NW78_9GAMM|nr:DUF1937 family protein [Pseudomonas argentinensis]KAB0549761.1 DUF1937 family protein [Pseudomonas argentinensis]SFJ13491.1 protein of unknown function [Pseudomonas argentinensis]
MSMHLIYVAGPYRGPDRAAIVRNIAGARAVAIHAAEQGWFPVCPHLNTAHMEEDLPFPDDYWLAGTMLLMEQCAAVVLVPGWQNSTGTLAEVARAKQLGIPVFTNHKVLCFADEFRAPATPTSRPAPGSR